jgi:hypothetical protein
MQDTHTVPDAMDRLRARLRAANPVPPSYDHLFDADLLQRLTISDIVIGDDDDSVEDMEPVESVKRTRKRKPTLAGIKRQAVKAGVEVARYDFRPDGTISIVTGKPVGDIDMDDTSSPDPKWN